MNGRERLLRTLHGERADRIPIAPFLYYNAVYEMFDYVPDMDTFFDPPDFDPIEKFVEYCDAFGFDVLHSLGTVWDFWNARTTQADQTILRAWDDWDVTVSDERKGDDKRRSVTITTPGGQLHLVESYKRTSKYLIVSAPEEYLIKTSADFELIRRYMPPADAMDCRLISRAKVATGDKGLVATCTNGAFNQAAVFRSLEDLMTDPAIDEGFYREMMEFFVGWVIRRDLKCIENGADVVEVAANLASSTVGPRFFENQVMGYENQVIDALHAAGTPIIYHNCGPAAKIMHLYNKMDIDCLGYLVPPPFGDVDLDAALEVLKPGMALRGNIDQIEFMVSATPEQVHERVRQVVEKAKPRGNLILSTTDFFFDGTPYENIRAFTAAGLEYGRYAP
jgi:Uroporphyrinogen-III decarboxylase